MTTESMKALAKKKAKYAIEPTKSRTYVKGDTDIDYNDKPDFVQKLDSPDRVHEYEGARDSERNIDDLKKAKPMDGGEEDHASMNPRVKQARKFHMMKSLLGIMDEMD